MNDNLTFKRSPNLINYNATVIKVNYSILFDTTLIQDNVRCERHKKLRSKFLLIVNLSKVAAVNRSKMSPCGARAVLQLFASGVQLNNVKQSGFQSK